MTPEVSPWGKARLRWLLETERHPEHPRPEQVTPSGDWRVWYVRGGRGTGKTRTGAEDASDYMRRNPGCRVAGVFETFADGRDVAVEGESGLLSVIPPSCIADWNRSLGELVCVNGARFDIYTAEKPDQLRGPQHHRAWVDEPAKMARFRDTWDNLQFGLRLGDFPQVVMTGTPKPLPLLREIERRATTLVMQWSTWQNAHNLPQSFLDELKIRYAGTRLGMQEIEGEYLEGDETALWRPGFIEDHRLRDLPRDPSSVLAHLDLVRVTVGIDPSTWDPELGDDPGTVAEGIETGIVTVGIDGQSPPHVYVLADASLRARSEVWGRRAIDQWRAWQANYVTPESNLGGMVLGTLRAIDPTVPIYREGKRLGIRAKHAKRVRAEPVATLYEQGRVHHVGTFPELESQMLTWSQNESWSPDRIDALVYAVTALNPWVTGGPVETSASALVAASVRS